MVGIEDIASEFALEFGLRDLAEELRNVLFRCQDLVLFTGTQRSQHHVRWDDQYVQYVL